MLARTLSRRGYSIAIATLRNKNSKYLLDIKHFVLPGFRIFRKRFMFKTQKLLEYIAENKPIIHTIDAISDKMMRNHRHFNAPIEFGIDLDVYNPGAVSIPRQTQFLTEYNIAPHQKLITVISPLDVKLPALIDALNLLSRDDYIITLLGTAGRMRAKKISDMIIKKNLAGNIILAGAEHDLPSLLRASYATISLGHHSERLLKMACAMGRPMICARNAFGIDGNIELADCGPETIASALKTVLDLSAAKRQTFEEENLNIAKKFCIQKTINRCLGLYKLS